MKIQNLTGYQTRDIRRILCRAFKECGVAPADHRTIEVRVSYARKATAWGCAYLGRSIRDGDGVHVRWKLGHHMTWCIRSPKAGGPMVETAAAVAVHEIEHLKGKAHPHMVPDLRYCRPVIAPWAKDMPLRFREPKVVAKPTDEQKHAAAAAKVEQIKKEMFQVVHRLKKRLRKAQIQVAYYRRKMAACPTPPKEAS